MIWHVKYKFNILRDKKHWGKNWQRLIRCISITTCHGLMWQLNEPFRVDLVFVDTYIMVILKNAFKLEIYVDGFLCSVAWLRILHYIFPLYIKSTKHHKQDEQLTHRSDFLFLLLKLMSFKDVDKTNVVFVAV